MSQPRVYFVRHGQSQSNLDGVIAGWTDTPLTALGIQQAQQEAELIKTQDITFDYIVSSPLSRALDTAFIIADVIGYPRNEIVTLDDLRERNCGDFEGRPRDVLFNSTQEEQAQAHAESFTDLGGRIQSASRKITELSTGTILVVGHAGFYRAASAMSRGKEAGDGWKMPEPGNGKLLSYPLQS
jgi:probable phosphoglycerate mutase